MMRHMMVVHLQTLLVIGAEGVNAAQINGIAIVVHYARQELVEEAADRLSDLSPRQPLLQWA